MNEQDSLVGVLRTLLKWKWLIIIVTGLAAIGAVVVSLTLPNYYKSSAVFYPTNPAITDRHELFGSQKSQVSQSFFGSKEDINRMLSIANSAPLKGELIGEFNLKDHYEIDEEKRLADFYAMREFEGNYTAIKTELGAIEISMVDKDPQLAANIVNTTVAKVDKKNNEEMVNIKFKILDIFKDKVEEKQQEVSELTDSVATIADKYKIKATESADGSSVSYSGDSERKIAEYKVLKELLDQAVEELNQYKSLYGQYDASTQESISSVYIVEKAYPAVKKERPVRWLICVSTTLVALFVSVLGALFIEKLRDIRQQLGHG